MAEPMTTASSAFSRTSNRASRSCIPRVAGSAGNNPTDANSPGNAEEHEHATNHHYSRDLNLCVERSDSNRR
jgi:hypothetical protein